MTTNPISVHRSVVNNEMLGYCIRGIPIHRLMKTMNTTQLTCLCPPAYHGHRCEKQTQQVSLTVQLQVLSEFRTIFVAVITLIDDQQGIIQSYDQFNYLPMRDCKKKYNIYLLYATRPKNTSMNYTVRIDIYDRTLLEFRASWSFPIRFPFLPVHRMAVQLQIPFKKSTAKPNATHICEKHGQYLQYINSNNTFCDCNKGWSGLYCDIEHKCNCSPDSLCLGSHLCLCPTLKWGRRCHLKRRKCPCKNGGLCAWNDEWINQQNGFWCACGDGYSGITCEKRDTEILITFTSDTAISSSMLLHYIEVRQKPKAHNHITIFKKIALDEDNAKIYTSNPFHLLFMEIEPNTYYLGVLLQKYYASANITSTLTESKRCLSIMELFNTTIVERHLLRRIKLYHIPCQQRTTLACFYDEVHMCICNHDLHEANCFLFNHSMTYNCHGQSLCENQGRCFYDKNICPTSSMCVCDECSYGSNCQFSTKGFGISLDIILGYQIRPDVSFSQQRSVIKITTAIVTIMLLFGLISSILSIMTFQMKKTREVGCGYYLLVSSYASGFVFILFALKFFLLVKSQMNLITNRIFLSFTCISIEFLIKILVNLSDWLNACVGIERAIAASQEKKFNKAKTKRIAKWIIISMFILSITTNLQDPIYRRLMDDEEEHRTWCIVKYTPSIRTFNSTILLIHFLVPFILNIVSSFIIIFKVAHHRSTAQQQLSYGEQLRQQFYKFKHLFISPLVLIILALPRLVISFLSGCMKSPRNPWLFLAGYFISFVSPMLIFVVFVLPSKNYKKEFKATVARIRRYITQRRNA